jgi:hypothetical protein
MSSRGFRVINLYQGGAATIDEATIFAVSM